MKKKYSLYHGHRFPRRHRLRGSLVFRFSLSLRDIEQLLLERCVVVT
jgi:putative transposase